jgi:hypothetical protein
LVFEKIAIIRAVGLIIVIIVCFLAKIIILLGVLGHNFYYDGLIGLGVWLFFGIIGIGIHHCFVFVCLLMIIFRFLVLKLICEMIMDILFLVSY